jgi:hypothetical protein
VVSVTDPHGRILGFLDRSRYCFFQVAPQLQNIIKNILENNNEIEKNIQNETIHILETVIEQNSFQFDQEYYKQTDGLTMSAPSSSILAETYTQHMEHTQIYSILIEKTNNYIL